MQSIKNQLKPTKIKEVEIHKSAGILDDHAIRKTINIGEAYISKRLAVGIRTPTAKIHFFQPVAEGSYAEMKLDGDGGGNSLQLCQNGSEVFGVKCVGIKADGAAYLDYPTNFFIRGGTEGINSKKLSYENENGYWRFFKPIFCDGTISGSNLSGTNTGDQDLSGYVPYTGATTYLDMGSYHITADGVYSSTEVGATERMRVQRDGYFGAVYTGGEVPIDYDMWYPWDTGGSTYDATSWFRVPNTVYDPVNWTGGIQWWSNDWMTLYGGICGTTGDLHWEKNIILIGLHYFGDTNSYISQDASFLHITTDKVIDIGNQMQFNSGGALSFMGGNTIQWWDNVNNDAYDCNLYRGGDDLLKTDFNFTATGNISGANLYSNGLISGANLKIGSVIETDSDEIWIKAGDLYLRETILDYGYDFYFMDSTSTASASIRSDSNGNPVLSGDIRVTGQISGATIRATTNYKSSDGSTGETATITMVSGSTLTVKNGLITAHT